MVDEFGQLETFNLLLAEVGRGADFDSFVAEIFANSNSIQEGLSLAGNFNTENQQSATVGLFQYLANNRFVEGDFAVFFDSALVEVPRNASAIFAACRVSIINTGDSFPSNRLIEMALENLTEDKARLLLIPLATFHGVEVLKKIEEREIGSPLSPEMEKIRKRALEEAASAAPKQLMSYLLNSEAAPKDLLTTFQKWRSQSQKDTDEWLGEYAADLDDNQRSSILGALAFDEMENGNFDEFEKLRSQVLSEEIGETVDGWVYKHQKNKIIELAKHTPEKAIETLTDGSGNYPASLVKDAFQVWIRKDAEAAAQWVEDEGVNLPPETRQFVAITYAREAAKQGDIELAEQWADLIVDEERKARMMKQIESKR